MSLRRGEPASRRVAFAVVVAAVLLAAAAFFASIRSYALVGWDTLPQIASSRLDSPGDLLVSFTEAMAAPYFPYGALYRPLFNLSLGLDHALWGLDPLGYLLTGIVLYAATALATFVLASRLLGRGAILGPLAAVATFLLLPAHIQVVPIVSRRADMLCALALVLGTSAQVRRADRSMPRGAVVPAVFTLLAVASKEPGVLLIPVAFVTVLVLGGGTGHARVTRALAAAGVHGLAAGLVLLGRFAAIGGLGGHPMADPAGALTRLPPMLGRELLAFGTLGFLPASAGTCWALTVLAGGALAAATWGATRREGRTADRQRLLATVAIAVVWLVASASIFGAAGLFQTWYLFVPAPAFAVLVAVAVEESASVVRRPHARGRTAALATLLAVLAWIAWQGRYSPLVHRYGHWTRASAVERAYLGALRTRIEHAAPGTTVRVAVPPSAMAADPGPPIVRRAALLRPYSVQAWADLVFGDDRVLVRTAPHAPSDAERAGRVVVLLGPGSATVADPGRSR